MDKLIISPSPHLHSGDSIQKNMYNVLIALIPAFLVSLYCFGVGALLVTFVSVLACVATEYLIQRYLFKKQPTISDGSAIITGVLLAFNLPSNLPLWIVLVGAIFAIAVGKMTFGGLGKNIFNPALVGRVFLLISFPAQMTTWPVPQLFPLSYPDVVTGATTLTLLKGQAAEIIPFTQSFLGLTGGSLGEVSEIALLLGFAYLLFRKTITWHIPVAVIGSVALFSGLFYFGTIAYASFTGPLAGSDWSTLAASASRYNPLIHLSSGGIMLGAVFMATDYVTSPMTTRGMLIFGAGIGLLTMIIRLYGAYPEGVSFAILIMNAMTPLINNYCKPKLFGGK